MQTISYIITNCGDGSNSIQWFDRRLTRDERDKLEEADRYDSYSSGDGVQYNEMHFPDEFSVQGWASLNHITLENYEQTLSELRGTW